LLAKEVDDMNVHLDFDWAGPAGLAKYISYPKGVNRKTVSKNLFHNP
jgi:hypothetical protein